MKKVFVLKLVVLLVLLTVQGFAQTQAVEEEVWPTSNMHLRAAYDKIPAFKLAPAPGDTINIPVFDDFSQQPHVRPFIANPELSVFPKSSVWLDKKVFINHTMAINPPTIGVATFDGTDSTGRAYDLNILNSDTADVLTSKPIFLANSTDSVYFSFWYQAGGLGEAPNGSGGNGARRDSLRVEFRSPTNDWTIFKSIPGDTSKPFDIVMIAVPDSFQEDGFQFRFMNLGSLGGVFDTWHIDYVLLDEGRSFSDTNIIDLAFVQPHPNLINDFQQIPWNHYLPNQDLLNKDSIEYSAMNYRFNFATLRFRNEDYDNTFSQVFTSDTSFVNRPSRSLLNFKMAYGPDVSSIPTSLTDGFSTYSKVYFNQPSNFSSNDTLLFEQKFDNHYAYDDGTAEKAYGVSSSAGLRIAYKFDPVIDPLVGDSLRGLKIFFQQAEIDATFNSFTIVVWDVGSDGKPGNIIYESDSIYRPRYYYNHNEFITYRLEESIEIRGPFFVGVRKTLSSKLNIGLDKNNDSRENLYIRPFGSQWRQSTITGAVMMRPIFGAPLENDLSSGEEPIVIAKKFNFKVFPNPTNGFISVDVPTTETDNYTYVIMDAYGRMRMQNRLEQQLDVSQLEAGLYFIQLSNQKNGNVSTQKFVVAY